jgi:hypothetical protein
MDRSFSDEDRKKRVVTADGQTIGTVREVEEDRATVDRTEGDDSLTDEIKDLLGWDDDHDAHELRRDDVERYDDKQLYLKQRR